MTVNTKDAQSPWVQLAMLNAISKDLAGDQKLTGQQKFDRLALGLLYMGMAEDALNKVAAEAQEHVLENGRKFLDPPIIPAKDDTCETVEYWIGVFRASLGVSYAPEALPMGTYGLKFNPDKGFKDNLGPDWFNKHIAKVRQQLQRWLQGWDTKLHVVDCVIVYAGRDTGFGDLKFEFSIKKRG